MTSPATAASKLVFLDRSQALDYVAAPPAGPEPELDPHALASALRGCANDTFNDAVVVGWARGALDLIASDAVARNKRITWFVRRAEIAFLDAALAAHSSPPALLRVAVCEDRDDLPELLGRLPTCWGLAVLDATLCTAEVLSLYGRHRFQRMRLGMPRKLGDLHHLLSRCAILRDSVPLRRWKGAWRGATALCVAAGPSLNRRLDFLRRHAPDCVVIAVDAVHKKLRAAGIIADFVLTVDSSPLSLLFFDGVAEATTTLVMPLTGHRAHDDHFVSRTYFDHGPLARRLLGDEHTFDTGTTVGVASVGLARYLGCADVVLLGHDLAHEDGFYSDLAPPELAAWMAANPSRSCRVPGNGGRDVRTEPLFEIAVHDLGMIATAWRDGAVYNPNIPDGLGARIRGTVPLPGGWSPRPRRLDPDGARPDRFASGELPDDPAATLRALALDQAELAREAWRGGAPEDRRTATRLAELMNVRETSIAAYLLYDVLNGPLLHLTRLESLPPSIAAAWQRRQVVALAGEVFDRAPALLALFLDPQGCARLEGREPPTVHAEALYALLQRSVITPEDHPASSILGPPMCAFYDDLLYAAPDVALPPPQSANEGLMVLQHLHVRAPRAYLLEVLSLCALEAVAEPVAWAHRTGALPAAWLTGIVDPASPTCVRAADAVLRLRARRAVLDGDVGSAGGWPPARLHLVRALVAAGREGLDALQALLRREAAELDDQTLALILLNAQPFDRACALVAPYAAAFGEATTLAMAQRRRENRDPAGGLRLARGFRPLSRFVDQARLVACECLRDLGDGVAANSEARRIADSALRERALALAGGGVDSRVADDLAVLAGETREAWQRRDRGALLAIRSRVARLAGDTGADGLARNLDVLLRNLG